MNKRRTNGIPNVNCKLNFTRASLIMVKLKLL